MKGNEVLLSTNLTMDEEGVLDDHATLTEEFYLS
jgi:hypothetical protein